ncbi:hypothetical protein DVU_1482 [Nitratidesulfovibrio vulgaris str. Hildenborough]|uniref:Uncharacterized protein n=1 Tax=Nitratidesulfovibrio vulgaris (strain ATCC 29579 / DSM 644 / CCUG 34227 / NCIMB 8303 / VKM B-1760 / Hildenborough) TaxID=882 RepID=Q72C02_NITV2|nr:hypothetical protein DVU_1482 [Nitratidesulfovibrio vulgaris str. Hildenborough]
MPKICCLNRCSAIKGKDTEVPALCPFRVCSYCTASTRFRLGGLLAFAGRPSAFLLGSTQSPDDDCVRDVHKHENVCFSHAPSFWGTALHDAETNSI